MRILIFYAICVLLATTTQAAGNKSNKFAILYTVGDGDDCTITPLNKTAVSYESESPYADYDKCNANFTCSVGKILEYRIQRFEIERSRSCYYDSLGLYIN